MNRDEKKRLALASSLLGNPDILLFDEPVLRKDKEERQRMVSIIQMLGRVKTVLVSTSDFSVARELGEDVVILSDGKVLTCGRFEELEAKLMRNKALRITTRGDAELIVSTIEALDGVIFCRAEKSRKANEVCISLEYRADSNLRELLSGALAEIGSPILSMSADQIMLEDVYNSLVSASDRSTRSGKEREN